MELIEKINFNDSINAEIERRIKLIEAFNNNIGEIEVIEKTELLELRNIATVQSIGSSTRIEGATLTDAEVDTLIKDIQKTSLESRDEQEVMGYFDVLDLIYESYDALPLTENIIRQMHSILLKYSTKDASHKGGYKKLSNKVVANYPDGRQRVIFNTTEPHLTSMEMEKLVSWVNSEIGKAEIHPIVISALFVYVFLSIHPFQDGNGRLSRLLTTLILLRCNYKFIKYISFENHIELHKEAYYSALMNGQKNRYSEEENIEEWMMFFTGSMVSLVDKLQTKLDAIHSKSAVYLNDRHKKVISILKKNKLMKFSDFEKQLKSTNSATLKKDLAYLALHKLIKKQGQLKATLYSI